MKNISLIILLTVAVLNLMATVPMDKTVQWDYEKVSLKEVLQDIETSESITFSYGNVKLNQNVSIQFNGSLEDGLKQLFKADNIIFKVIGDQIVLKYGEIKGKDIKGRILDTDAGYALIGATIIVEGSNPLIGTTTDVDGYFRLSNLTVGRYDLKVEYIGFETRMISQVLVTTGKEVYLKIDMVESAMELDEVVITAKIDKTKPQNDMATLSARSFSVEDSKRYAAAISDPARMAQSYAGVSSGGDDLSNEIIIRGNSARGLLWRLEGVDIPSPNHFGDLGSGGGNISMLSSSTLSNSDFYTGAFPAEFGSALSGVFDLKMRNGNTDDREYSIMFGNLGLEVATEGYFKKGSDASYLVNYRFSTLGFMGKFLPSLQDAIPAYQDLSFKVNVPTTKAGIFTVFGLGGVSTEDEEGIRDSTQWVGGSSHYDHNEKSRLGVLGITHKYLFENNKSYMKTSLSGSAYTYSDLTEVLIAHDDYRPENVDETHFNDYDASAAVTLNHKFNALNSLRAGVSIHNKIFNYSYESTDNETNSSITFFDNKGNAQYLESYIQHKLRFAEKWTLNSGVNFSYFFLNNTYGIDPRIGLKWNFRPNQSLAVAAGLHSKPEHTSTYLIERINNGMVTSPNIDLEMTKAVHTILSYDLSFAKDFRLKIEAYYQYLYNVPVSVNQSSGFSVLNSAGVFDIIFMNDKDGEVLVSEGTGINYGLDITLEKFFSKGYYFLVTGSIFDSKYSTLNNEYYRTLYANNYIFNLLGGKEFTIGKKKKNLFAINGKFTYYDGRRQTPINLESSREVGYTVRYPDSYYTEKLKPYYRFDLGIAYTANAKRSTHSLMFDVQNLTNHFNIYGEYFEPFTDNVESIYQNGAVPVVNYRVEF
ncbi:MAG: TonB-dependent receptor [Bacteroidetes bacterium]|nr:TonB-dependent receptor [Bacteroidota bacterium]